MKTADMGVTGNAVLVLGFLAGAMDSRRSDAWYQLVETDPGAGTAVLKHHANGNTFRVSVVQIDGTD